MKFNLFSLENNFSAYVRLFEAAKKKSVYHLPSYLNAAQIGEKYPIEIMVVNNQNEFAMLPFVKKKINDLHLFKDLSKKYCDVTSPYEYASPLSSSSDPKVINSLFLQLFVLMDCYCNDENIISEFIRFDPFTSDITLLSSHYKIKKSCDNIYIDLTKNIDELWKGFHGSAKKNIKRAMDSALFFFKAEKNKVNVNLFIDLYNSSMKRLNSRDFYYFSDRYFKKLILECEGTSLFFVRDKKGSTIAASIVIYYGETAHHHLTGYDSSATDLRQNDFMIYSLIIWGKASGLKHLHLGGGSESICRFKGKFSTTRIPYYVGTKVHNKATYNDLCNLWREKNNFHESSEYFPIYRMEI